MSERQWLPCPRGSLAAVALPAVWMLGLPAPVLAGLPPSLQRGRDDAELAARVIHALSADGAVRDARITVQAYSRAVRLGGVASTDSVRIWAAQIAAAVPGVVTVVNEVAVIDAPPLAAQQPEGPVVAAPARTALDTEAVPNQAGGRRPPGNAVASRGSVPRCADARDDSGSRTACSDPARGARP